LKSSLEYLLGLELWTQQELQREKPLGGAARIKHLEVYYGYCCLLCKDINIFYTIHLPRIEHHMSSYKRKAKEHKLSLLWEGCMLQTYFTANGRIDYFVVVKVNRKERILIEGIGKALLTDLEKACFEELEKDY
jgi:hypothetical protein